jgi:hypothetical protein
MKLQEKLCIDATFLLIVSAAGKADAATSIETSSNALPIVLAVYFFNLLNPLLDFEII